MTQEIKRREYLFRERPRRTRPAFALALIGAVSLVAANVSNGVAGSDDDARAEPAVYGALDDTPGAVVTTVE